MWKCLSTMIISIPETSPYKINLNLHQRFYRYTSVHTMPYLKSFRSILRKLILWDYIITTVTRDNAYICHFEDCFYLMFFELDNTLNGHLTIFDGSTLVPTMFECFPCQGPTLVSDPFKLHGNISVQISQICTGHIVKIGEIWDWYSNDQKW